MNIVSRMHAFLCAAIFLCSAMPAPAQRTYYEENFRNYCDKAPGVVEDNGMSVDNEPIWDWAYGAKLCVRAERDGLVYKGLIKAPGLATFDLNFRFAFLNNAPGVFSLVLADASGKTTDIDFSREGVSDAKFPLPMANRQFEEAYLKADGSKIAVYGTDAREFKKLCEIPYSGKLAGFNFKAFAGVEFAVSNIVLSDPVPMKAFPVERHFAAMKSLTRKSGAMLWAEAGAVVDLNAAAVGRMLGIRMKLTLTRGPYAYPKRAYVAYAVLTSVLDGAKFSRQLDSGSTTVYAVEFKRLDGNYVTALWAARGDVVFDVDCPAGCAQLIAMYGGATPLTGQSFQVASGTSPVYLVTDKPLTSVKIAFRSFPKAEALARSGNEVKIELADRIDVRPDPTIESTHTKFLPILKPAGFTVTGVVDDQAGKCIEVVLDVKDKYQSKYVTEYTTLRFKEPVPLPGTPEVLWARVKGNSNWGQVRFEIEDARGEVFKNLSTGHSWGCDIMDWPGNLCVNFDGWGVVYQTLTRTSLVNDHSPGPYSDQWVSEGGDKVIQFPIKVRAITVGMNRQKLDLLDFKTSAPAIRISAVGATGAALSRETPGPK